MRGRPIPVYGLTAKRADDPDTDLFVPLAPSRVEMVVLTILLLYTPLIRMYTESIMEITS